MTRSRWFSIPLAVAAGALVLSSCGSPDPQVTGPAPANTSTADTGSTPGTDMDAEADAGIQAALSAIALAENEVGGEAYELEREDGGWEVKVAADDRGTSVRIDAAGTEVQSSSDDDIDDDDRAALDGRVALSAALQIAAREYGGQASLEGVEASDDDDTVSWEVSFSDDVEVYVSVADGTVIRVDN